MELLLFMVVLGAALALAVLSQQRRARKVRELARHGIAVAGVVSRTMHAYPKGRLRFVLLYEYTVNGAPYSGRAVISREQSAKLAAGAPLEVRYLAQQPAVSAPQFVLDAHRPAATT